jgi:hypothetical protein
VEAELAALAASGATSLVGLMVSDAWTQARDRLARLFVHGGSGAGGATAELDAARAELVSARAAGDDGIAADIEAECAPGCAAH